MFNIFNHYDIMWWHYSWRKIYPKCQSNWYKWQMVFTNLQFQNWYSNIKLSWWYDFQFYRTTLDWNSPVISWDFIKSVNYKVDFSDCLFWIKLFYPKLRFILPLTILLCYAQLLNSKALNVSNLTIFEKI